ncbi:phage holin family protein [Arthrobacter cavernae]|uniref:Phage holin family protein n=1 Tax=Arthrobacter cavernae TaxID=2817681 RepID=A0A939KM74_9MICC|nr:phage holin family protein [Arthrobacter cavernae]MBO1266385.1 phage holin family protein [Arthrobacter cavernae]
MSGRHTGRTGHAPGIRALPKTLKLVARLAPRQLNDEINLAKAELKRKGNQLGVAGAFFGVALVFLSLLVIALVVAAVMGLATIMPAWLAALLVSAFFLVIVLLGGMIGYLKFKKALPLVPGKTIQGLKHDLGIAKEGTAFDASSLDPASEAAQAAKAAKAAAAETAKAEKAAKAAAHDADAPKPASEAELERRLKQRREHLAGVRDHLGTELDIKTQGRVLLDAAGEQLRNGGQFASSKLAGLAGSVPPGLPERLAARWKDLLAFAAAGTVLVVALRKLLRK